MGRSGGPAPAGPSLRNTGHGGLSARMQHRGTATCGLCVFSGDGDFLFYGTGPVGKRLMPWAMGSRLFVLSDCQSSMC